VTTHPDANASFAVARRLFSDDDCARIRALAGRGEAASVLAPARDGGTVRRSEVAWLPSDARAGWVRGRLDAARIAMPFDVDIDGVEPLQVARYGAGDGYSWHIDLGPGSLARRKLSVSVLLSDPASFEGGAVEFGADVGVAAGLGRGDAVVFPSYLRHRVAPVRSGERWSLVAWFTGPPFR
jgi:PKHD-type hydroxylase